MKNPHIGSNFDDFLQNENLLEHAITTARMRILTKKYHSQQSQKSCLKQSKKKTALTTKIDIDVEK